MKQTNEGNIGNSVGFSILSQPKKAKVMGSDIMNKNSFL